MLAAHDSAPLAVAVQDLNKRSNNFAAEQLLRTIGAEIGGHPGSWDKGLKAVERYLAGIGIKAGAYQMRCVLRDGTTEHVGSATQFIEVPDVSKGRLTLSGIVMSGDKPAEALRW